MLRSFRALLSLSLCLWAGVAWTAPVAKPAPGAQPAAEPKLKETAHYGVYMLGSRIGSMVTKTFEGRYEGKPAVRTDADTSLSVAALGPAIEQKISMTEGMTEDGKPLMGRVEMSSMGRVTRINTRY